MIMKRPGQQPPSLREITRHEPVRGAILSSFVGRFPDDYLPWEKQRFHQPPAEAEAELETWRIADGGQGIRPDALKAEEWWAVLRAGRDAQARPIPSLTTVDGTPFRFTLTDEVLRASEFITAQLSGDIGFDVDIENSPDRDRYIRSALEEEAITSSQLEGAATTRAVAKDMLRTGRRPRDNSERMILNNFLAMQRVRELTNRQMTPGIVREIHAIVTEATLDSPSDGGRLQRPDEARVVVMDTRDDTILHIPPPAEELPARLDRLCAFANATEPGPYMPGVLRALTVHFMVSYDHYFVDGNGRTARALFYWTMLHHGHWLAEYLTISTILRKAYAQYANSFTETEHDGGDLTYFFLYHLDVLRRAIEGLKGYISRTISEQHAVRERLDLATGEFNLRQITVLADACQEPRRRFTAGEIARRFGVTVQTGRNDLDDLVTRGWMTRRRVGRRHLWEACGDLADRLKPG